MNVSDLVIHSKRTRRFSFEIYLDEGHYLYKDSGITVLKIVIIRIGIIAINQTHRIAR